MSKRRPQQRSAIRSATDREAWFNLPAGVTVDVTDVVVLVEVVDVADVVVTVDVVEVDVTVDGVVVVVVDSSTLEAVVVVVVFFGIAKRATRIAASAIPKQRAASIDSNKHRGEHPPGHLRRR